jgi:hypothetical protein
MEFVAQTNLLDHYHILEWLFSDSDIMQYVCRMLITGNFEKMHKVFNSSEHPKFY